MASEFVMVCWHNRHLLLTSAKKRVWRRTSLVGFISVMSDSGEIVASNSAIELFSLFSHIKCCQIGIAWCHGPFSLFIICLYSLMNVVNICADSTDQDNFGVEMRYYSM